MSEDIMSNAWQIFGMVVLAALIALGIAWIVEPKRVDGYYLSHGTGAATNQAAVCVYAHWTWHLDEVSFCTDNYQNALEFVSKANAAVK